MLERNNRVCWARLIVFDIRRRVKGSLINLLIFMPSATMIEKDLQVVEYSGILPNPQKLRGIYGPHQIGWDERLAKRWI